MRWDTVANDLDSGKASTGVRDQGACLFYEGLSLYYLLFVYFYIDLPACLLQGLR